MSRLYATGYNGTTRTLEQLLVWSQWQHLDAEYQRRALWALDASATAGSPLGIGGIFRTYDEQRRGFISRHHVVPAGTAGAIAFEGQWWLLNAGAAPLAPPGSSYHEATTPELDNPPPWSLAELQNALAIDFIGNLAWLKANAAKCGLVEFTRLGEPWHAQPVEIPAGRSRYTLAKFHPLAKFTLPGMPTPGPTRVLAPTPPIYQGHANDPQEVRELQLQCNFWGWRDAMKRTLVVDGQFGPLSAQAVMAMQTALHIVSDGRYGNQSHDALQKFLDWAASQ